METIQFILIGCISLCLSYYFIKKSTQAASWPTTIGYIVFCDLESGCGIKKSYRVKVTYSYIVGDREYHNDTLAFGYRKSRNKVPHEKILTQLRNAESVRVSYDPYNPKSSVISYGIPSSIKCLIAFGCCFLLWIFNQLMFNHPMILYLGGLFAFVSHWLSTRGSERDLLKNLVTY